MNIMDCLKKLITVYFFLTKAELPSGKTGYLYQHIIK